MTLTLNSNWLERAGRDGYEERFLVSITKGATTWDALSAQCSAFSYPVAVRSVEPLAAQMDLSTRRLEIDGNTVMVDDTWLRDILVSNRLRGAKLRIRHGFVDLALSDFIEYGTYVIEGVFPEPSEESNMGVVRLECLSVLEVMRQTKVTGFWVQMHPLDVIYDILVNKAGIDTSLIDTAVFDPDLAAYTSISHIVVTRASVGPFYTDGSVREPTPALDLVDELAMPLNGTLYVTEDGKLSFRIFDATAAVADTWDGDVIDGLKQLSLDDDLYNRVEFNFKPADQAAYYTLKGKDSSTYGMWNGTFVANDTDSQSAHAYPGTSERIITLSASSPWIGCGSAMADTGTAQTIAVSASATTFRIRGGCAPTFCGTRESSLGTASQPANAKISAARPMYLLTDNLEIIKVESLSTVYTSASGNSGIDIRDVDGSLTFIGPFHWMYTAASATRGALGTTPATFSLVIDVTTQQYLADQWLKRFAYGIPRVEVKTGLSQMDKEVGDLIALEWPAYLAYGLDGIDAGDGSWEIILKEHDPENNCIRWVLAGATLTVAPTTTHRGLQDRWSRGVVSTTSETVRGQTVITSHIVSGFEVTPTSGLGVSVAPGVASAGVARSELLDDQEITLPAADAGSRKDHYIFWNLEVGALLVDTVAHGDEAPDVGRHEILLAKVVVTDTEVISITTDDAPVSPINGQRIAAATIDTTQLAERAVTFAQLATSAVQAQHIAAGAVTTPAIGHAVIGSVHQITNTKKAGMFSNANFAVASKK